MKADVQYRGNQNKWETVLKGIIFQRQIGFSAGLGQGLAKQIIFQSFHHCKDTLGSLQKLLKQTKRPIKPSSKKWKLVTAMQPRENFSLVQNILLLATLTYFLPTADQKTLC